MLLLYTRSASCDLKVSRLVCTALSSCSLAIRLTAFLFFFSFIAVSLVLVFVVGCNSWLTHHGFLLGASRKLSERDTSLLIAALAHVTFNVLRDSSV